MSNIRVKRVAIHLLDDNTGWSRCGAFSDRKTLDARTRTPTQVAATPQENRAAEGFRQNSFNNSRHERRRFRLMHDRFLLIQTLPASTPHFRVVTASPQSARGAKSR